MYNRLLRYFEQKTHLSIRQHSIGTLWLFSGQILGSIASLTLTVLMANTLSEEQFGTYKYLLTILGVIGIVSLTGLITSSTRAVAQGFEGSVKRSIVIALRHSWIMLVVGGIISGYYLIQGNLTIGLGVLVATLASPFLTSLPLYLAIVNGRHDHKTFSLLNIAINIIPVIVTSGGLFFSKNILLLFLLFIGSQLLLHLALYKFVYYKYKPNTKDDPTSHHYGKHLSAMNILGGISYQLDKLVVWHFLGPAQLALYTLAIAPAQQLRYLNKIITTISLPRFSKQPLSKLKRYMLPKLLVIFAGSIILVAGYLFIAPFIFNYFVPEYTDAIIYSQIFSVIILFFPASLLQEALKAQAQQKALYVVQTIIPSTKIALLLVLTPVWGIYGVLASMFVCETIRLFIVSWYFYHPRTSAEHTS